MAVRRPPSVHEGFGLRFACDFPLPELPATAAGPPDLRVRLAPATSVEAAFSGPRAEPLAGERNLGDGDSYRTELGRAGDCAIDYRGRATFLLSADGRELACAPDDPDDPAWRRFLLDTVLTTASLVQGFEALHAASCQRGDELLAVVALSGGGKSTLAVELVRRSGAVLFGDDILALSQPGDTVLGHPAPPLMNLPARLPDGRAAADVGRVLGTFGSECWTVIDRPEVAPAPVTAVALLARQPRSEQPDVDVRPLPPSPTPLLSHSLLSGGEPERLVQRFRLFATLAGQARLLYAAVPDDLAPETVADELLGAINSAVPTA